MDVHCSTKCLEHQLQLLFCVREPVSQRRQKLHEVSLLNVNTPQKLKGIKLGRHHKVRVNHCTVPDKIKPSNQGINGFVRPSLKRDELGHRIHSCFCVQGGKTFPEPLHNVRQGIKLHSIDDTSL
jgi:hypothetical protein